MNGDTSKRRRELSAPESEVRLRGPKTSDCQALELASKELVARDELGFVIMEERRRIGPAQRIAALTRGPGGDADLGRCLQAVLEIYENARPPVQQPERLQSLIAEDFAMIRSSAQAHQSPRGVRAAVGEAFRVDRENAARAQAHAYADGIGGIPVRELAAKVFKRYPSGGQMIWGRDSTHGYVHAEVLPVLEARGFYTPEAYGRLGCFGAARWVLTPAGAAAKAESEARLAISGQARRNSDGRGPAGERRTLAESRGALDAIAAFAAIDRGVNRGWDDVHAGE